MVQIICIPFQDYPALSLFEQINQASPYKTVDEICSPQEVEMMKMEDIKKDIALVNEIDWEMSPEEAVTLYLEWGNNWSHDRKFVKSKNDVSYYFVLNTWGEEPVVYLIRRNSAEATELAEIRLPELLEDKIKYEYREGKGVYAVEGALKDWLREELEAV